MTLIQTVARKVLAAVSALAMSGLIVGIGIGFGGMISAIVEGGDKPAHLTVPIIVGMCMGVVTSIAFLIDVEFFDLFKREK